LDFLIDSGETIDEIKVREEAEREAKRHVNYGQYTTDADTTMLLAALIYCEAGGESYEGKVAVGAVVMNRVRSSAYPDTIHSVIYASGQFTPAMSGKVNRVLAAGKVTESCIQAAEDAISGVSNVGDMTHFRRNNGREGLVIGNHVFY
jgi:spore germination cell wall hydrolase CwlJ-like protein